MDYTHVKLVMNAIIFSYEFIDFTSDFIDGPFKKLDEEICSF